MTASLNNTSTHLSAIFASIDSKGPEATAAFGELAQMLLDIELHWSSDPELTDQMQAARRYLVANALQHGGRWCGSILHGLPAERHMRADRAAFLVRNNH